MTVTYEASTKYKAEKNDMLHMKLALQKKYKAEKNDCYI